MKDKKKIEQSILIGFPWQLHNWVFQYNFPKAPRALAQHTSNGPGCPRTATYPAGSMASPRGGRRLARHVRGSRGRSAALGDAHGKRTARVRRAKPAPGHKPARTPCATRMAT